MTKPTSLPLFFFEKFQIIISFALSILNYVALVAFASLNLTFAVKLKVETVVVMLAL